MATSAQILAEAASEQGASLEETSAALEEMSSMTKKNAETAQQARALSGEAHEAALRGNAAMQKMSGAIGQIQKSASETAKIINPAKRVLLPDLDAGCSLSESCPPEKLKAFLDAHAGKNYYVIAYINCSAGVKAQSDVICTSANADKIVRAAPADRNILFVPDQNLGAWVMERTGRKMDLWQGNCYIHVEFTARSINRIREQFPDAPVVAHPECTYAVRLLADEVCSTEKMIGFCKESPAREIIVVTEAGMLHRLKKEIPGKIFIPGPTENCFCGECRFMKMNTLEKAHAALLNMAPEIILPESLRKRAEAPILRMLELSK